MRRISLKAIAILLAGSFSLTGFSGEIDAPNLKKGASVFYERCTLCHGNDGMGEGLLPLSLKDYPPTNLLTGERTKGIEQIRHAVIYGGAKNEMSKEMPPWGDELTHYELESVSLFTQHLRDNTKEAIGMVTKEAESGEPTARLGRSVFVTRCTLCHGQYGEGDGRMARVIKNPPPFNLTLSGLPDQYLRDIIMKGGTEVGRSERMPPWGADLNEVQLASLVLYLKSIRKYK